MKSLTFLIKPASSLCNMRCTYCFYEDISENRAQKHMGIMTDATAERIISEAKAAASEIVAKAEAEKLVVAARAEKEANTLKNQALTPELLEKM